MTLITKNTFTNSARGSQARAAVELANIAAALELSKPLSAAACATGTTASKAKTTATLTFTINGVFKTKGATDDFWTLSGTTVAVSSWQKYLLLIDGAGAASIQEATQSKVSAAAVGWSNVSALSSWAPLLSILNAGKTIAGVLTIATDATHTFIPGTTLFSATGITATFIDGIDQSLLPVIANEVGLIVGNGG